MAPLGRAQGKRFTVEIADDDAERSRGLMFRDELAADSGMIFIHDDETPQAYWMKNTKIPLDILYFDRSASWFRPPNAFRPARRATSARPFRATGPAITCWNSMPAWSRRWA